MPRDTSFVTKGDAQLAFKLKNKYGPRLGFWRADQELGYPSGTMASYFGKLGAKKKKENKERIEMIKIEIKEGKYSKLISEWYKLVKKGLSENDAYERLLSVYGRFSSNIFINQLCK